MQRGLSKGQSSVDPASIVAVISIACKRGDVLMTISKGIEKYLLTEIAADLGKQSLDPEEDLLEQGVIDSMGILKLVVFLEKSHGIRVKDEDVVPENFQNLNSMVRFVEQKMQSQ
jgi:acyl carrier protein